VKAETLHLSRARSAACVAQDGVATIAAAGFKTLFGLLKSLPLLFLVTLSAMLLRPPDVQFYNLDRWALLLLCGFGSIRAMLGSSVLAVKPMLWPMAGMVALAIADIIRQPFEIEAWSVAAAKWIVPFVLYHLVRFVFDDQTGLRKLEIFCWMVLAYLILLAVFFVCGAKSWIFPQFITDESIGIHADRARGPFLQAVPNGMALNLLGLLALDSYRRKQLPKWLGIFFLIGLPIAIAATLTRAVWLSFAASVLVLLFWAPQKRIRRLCLSLAIIGILGIAAAFAFKGATALSDRLNEKGTVEFRLAIYQAGWEMFLSKPLQGWGFDGMQRELTSRISEFHQEQFFFHNTFLEVTVQYGLAGLGLYLWTLIELIKLARKNPGAEARTCFLDQQFRSLWPVLLMVYVLNGCFVVLNYQFINGLVFSIAGLLAAQNAAAAGELHLVDAENYD
jgi:O-antigen ligase